MSNNSHSTGQFVNSTDSRGSATPNSPGSVRPSARELHDRAVLIAHAATVHIASRQVELGSDGVLASPEVRPSAVGPVTVIDRESEELIRSLIETFSNSDHILDEEGGFDGDTGSQAQTTDVPEPVTWIVDPIDSAASFLYGLPNFAVSTAYTVGDEVVAGVVANVHSGEIYCATKGEGIQASRWNDVVQALSCSPTTELEKTLVVTGFSYPADLRQVQDRMASQLLRGCRDTRRMGSAAFDLCMVTHGRINAYYKHDIKIQDYAVGVLIAAEAGAKIRIPEFSECANAAGRPEGDPLNFGISAANPEVADAFYEALDGVISKTRNQCVDLGTDART